ncbi:hypothetical protein EJ06DRAFT_480831 [Trichodelitschia bisporula]|uniref:Cytidyltransferase-like domain-containing protein n=1 Tax=Trichodelitschia bisporula TaxID=703511 RepID=A0A6G1HQM1_9PEZI|nr:hypothetical protein EJ06DRAFT_480831 [Trichodelitschia bisporula]
MPAQPVHGLLLLPPAPPPSSPSTLSVALSPPLSDTLKRLSKLANTTGSPSILDIALPTPGFHRPAHEVTHRAQLFSNVQAHLRAVYTLIAGLCAENNYPTTGPRAIDIRIILLAYNPSQPFSAAAQAARTSPPAGVVDLPVLAVTPRPWTHIFIVHSEPGEALFTRFNAHASEGITARTGPSWSAVRVRGGIQICSAGDAGPSVLSVPGGLRERQSFSSVACWGVFDRLHFGHKLMLTMAAFLLPPGVPQAAQLVVGLTEGPMLSEHAAHAAVQPVRERARAIEDFLGGVLRFGTEAATKPPYSPDGMEIVPGVTVQCRRTENPYGPGTLDAGLEALVLATESVQEAKAVNEGRWERHWEKLEVFEIGMVVAGESDEQAGKKVGSASLRRDVLRSDPGLNLPIVKVGNPAAHIVVAETEVDPIDL